MAEHTVNLTVVSDMSEVTEDIKLLESQLVELSETVTRLKSNGIDVKLSFKLNQGKFFHKLFNIKS